MKNLMCVFAILTSLVWAHHADATQLELPFKSADQILIEAMPWSANARYVNNLSSLPAKIVEAFGNVDLAFEMGDGYYDVCAQAYYEVRDESGVVVGYIEAVLATYTEDSGYYLGMAYINAKGRRLEADPHHGEYELADLPSELQPEIDHE